jgi:HEAT repeat protein
MTVLTALVGLAGALWAGDAPDALVKELTGESPAQQRTPEQLDAAYTTALAALLPDMGSDDAAKQKDPQQKLQKMGYRASRPDAEPERLAFCKTVAAKLGADVPATARVWMLRQLENAARAEAVAAMAGALADKDALVRETARRALQNNPTPEAGEALRKALQGADKAEWTLALINALGYRKEAADLPALMKHAASDDDGVRAAAVCALASLGDKSAADVIAAAMGKGSDAAKRAATDSYLLLADKLAAKGEKDAALAIAKKMLSAEGHVKCAAIVALGRAGGPAELNTILEVMNDKDAKIRGAGLEALNNMTSPEVTKAIAEKVKTASPELKVALLRALAVRKDKSVLPTFVACLEDASDDVKVEALQGIAGVGDASTIPVLLKAAAGTGRVAEAARSTLDRIPSKDVDEAMVASLGTADAKGKAEVARSLAARRVEAAVPALLKAVEDADGGVRQEAWKAAGQLADGKSLPAMVALLVKAQDADREEAKKATVATSRRIADAEARAQPILAALPDAKGPARLTLLSVLGGLGGPKPVAALRAALKDADKDVHDATVRALADCPDTEVIDDLLAIAKGEETEPHKVLALRGYFRLVGASSKAPKDKVAAIKAGMDVAKRPDEKKLGLSGLAEVNNFDGFQIVEACLAEPALKNEAEQAAVKIAKGIWNGKPEEVRTVLEQIIASSKQNNVKGDAKKILDEIAKKKPKGK